MGQTEAIEHNGNSIEARVQDSIDRGSSTINAESSALTNVMRELKSEQTDFLTKYVTGTLSASEAEEHFNYWHTLRNEMQEREPTGVSNLSGADLVTISMNIEVRRQYETGLPTIGTYLLTVANTKNELERAEN